MWCGALTVRSCVLIKAWPKIVFPDRFVWAFSYKGLSKQDLGGVLFFSERLSPFFFWI